MLILSVLMMLALVGCNKQGNEVDEVGTEDVVEEVKKSIIVTSYPAYEWLVNVGGDRLDAYDVILLVNENIHKYKLTPEDEEKIKKCDMFIYLGIDDEVRWANDISVDNDEMIVLNLFDTVRSKGVVVEGGQHFWLSFRNALVCCKAIKDALVKFDPHGSNYYNDLYDRYKTELNGYDAQYTRAFEDYVGRSVVVVGPYAYEYIQNDYDIGVWYEEGLECSGDSLDHGEIQFGRNTLDKLNSRGYNKTICVHDGKVDSYKKALKDEGIAIDEITWYEINTMEDASKLSNYTYIGLLADTLNSIMNSMKMVE